MSLAERLSTPPVRNRGGRTCALCVAMDDMTDEDQDAVTAAIINPQCSDPWVAEQLQAEGLEDVTKSTVANHRRGRHRQ